MLKRYFFLFILINFFLLSVQTQCQEKELTKQTLLQRATKFSMGTTLLFMGTFGLSDYKHNKHLEVLLGLPSTCIPASVILFSHAYNAAPINIVQNIVPFLKTTAGSYIISIAAHSLIHSQLSQLKLRERIRVELTLFSALVTGSTLLAEGGLKIIKNIEANNQTHNK